MFTDAAESRLPFWGGAVCHRDDAKDAVLAGARSNRWDSYGIVEQSWAEASAPIPARPAAANVYIDLKHRLAELLLMRVDKMTMATSVEARVPFLDHELVEFGWPSLRGRRCATASATTCSSGPSAGSSRTDRRPAQAGLRGAGR